MRRLALGIATAGGVGYFPLAPGTAGSAVGVGLYGLTQDWPQMWQLVFLVVITLVGTWAGNAASRHLAAKDPGPVVIDEVAGQLVTLYATGVGLGGAIAGFLIFRVLDIVKPWPARGFERLPGGIGIMADDVMAGVYGNLILRAARMVLPGSW